jgi:hypothetical protein
MTRAASDKPMKVSVEKYVPPTELHVNLQKHPHMDGHEVGDTVHFSGKGKVTSISKDEHSKTMRLDMMNLKKMTANMKKNGPFDHGDTEHPAE